MENRKWKQQDSNLWTHGLQAIAFLTWPLGYLKIIAIKVCFKQKIYNLLSYSFEACTKQRLGNYNMPVKIWWWYLYFSFIYTCSYLAIMSKIISCLPLCASFDTLHWTSFWNTILLFQNKIMIIRILQRSKNFYLGMLIVCQGSMLRLITMYKMADFLLNKCPASRDMYCDIYFMNN